MATNPDNAIGTNAAYGGRTSVNAFNDDLAGFSRGVMSGWECTPNTGLVVSLGGDGSTRDVAVAEDNIGNKTTINNISGSPVDVTISAAPGTNSRVDAIVAYVDNPPQGEETVADNPMVCGIIPVSGVAAASPVAPTESAIRSAITADGASGTTAYYVVLAYITIPSGTTDITADNITAGEAAALSSQNVDFTTFKVANSYSLEEVNTGFTWIDGKPIYKKTINVGALPNNTQKVVTHGITNLDYIIDFFGVTYNPTANQNTGVWQKMPIVANDGTDVSIVIRRTEIAIASSSDRTSYNKTYITLYYTKTN